MTIQPCLLLQHAFVMLIINQHCEILIIDKDKKLYSFDYHGLRRVRTGLHLLDKVDALILVEYALMIYLFHVSLRQQIYISIERVRIGVFGMCGGTLDND